MQEGKPNLRIDQSNQDPEDPEFSLLVEEKRKTIAAIEKLNCRTTPSDLAASSDLSINQASYWLNKVAGETGGKLEVAADGTIYYSFAKDFKNSYLLRGYRRTALLVGAFLFNALYWIVRVSFGVALVLSVLVIIAIFIAIAVAAMSGGGDSGGDSGGGGDGGGFFDLGFLGDFFSWNWTPNYYSYNDSNVFGSYYPASTRGSNYSSQDFYSEKQKPKSNFFLKCFSFLFGDGKPNPNLQEIRWQQIARTIFEHGGVVSTEILAPFLDGDHSDQGMILTALAQFNGRPVVTPSGFIVYVFPDFLDHKTAPVLPKMERADYLKEQPWLFSAHSVESWTPVLLLALANFAGSWWLFKHIASIATLHSLALVIDILLSYAILFLLIPLIRFLVLMVLNKRIDERNERRKKAWEAIKSPDGDIQKEMDEAYQIRADELALLHPDRSIVYSTDRDSMEQEFEEKIQLKTEKPEYLEP